MLLIDLFNIKRKILELKKQEASLQEDVSKLIIDKSKVENEIKNLRNQKILIERQIGTLRDIKAKRKDNIIFSSLKIAVSHLVNRYEISLNLDENITQKQHEVNKLNITIEQLQKQIIELEDRVLYQDFGLYEPIYDCISSDEYNTKLKNNRNLQKQMIRDKIAVSCSTKWTVNGSVGEGTKWTQKIIKLAIRAFNGECEAVISKVKFNNILKMQERIYKAYSDINKLSENSNISISYVYFQLKLDELNIAYEYSLKKQEEKEEQARLREIQREEYKALKELEEAQKKLEKEEKHFENAIDEHRLRFETSINEAEKKKLENKIAELEYKLKLVKLDKSNIIERRENTRAGYVYIISNIGAFGENVYKIGVTRRLEPKERVNELGGASVPFKFDIHAMIFSEDAPSLETALHRNFADRRINRINNRKEFFKVSLEEIKDFIKNSYSKTVDFIEIPEAQDYRVSVQIEKRKNEPKGIVEE